MKVLFATTNPAKVKYYVSELQKRGIDAITLKDLNLVLEVEEDGKDAIENAKIKAKAYYQASKIMTIAIDDTLYMDGLSKEEQPGTNVRRVGGKRLDDQEMISYYTNLVKRQGGCVKGYWLHGIAVCKDGKVYTFQKKSERIFTDKMSDKVNEGYPLDSISIVPEYGLYRSELTIEQTQEQQQIKNKEIFDFLVSCLKN